MKTKEVTFNSLVIVDGDEKQSSVTLDLLVPGDETRAQDCLLLSAIVNERMQKADPIDFVILFDGRLHDVSTGEEYVVAHSLGEGVEVMSVDDGYLEGVEQPAHEFEAQFIAADNHVIELQTQIDGLVAQVARSASLAGDRLKHLKKSARKTREAREDRDKLSEELVFRAHHNFFHKT